MICRQCRTGADHYSEWGDEHAVTVARECHARCDGPTRCDCQHKVELQAAGKAVHR